MHTHTRHFLTIKVVQLSSPRTWDNQQIFIVLGISAAIEKKLCATRKMLIYIVYFIEIDDAWSDIPYKYFPGRWYSFNNKNNISGATKWNCSTCFLQIFDSNIFIIFMIIASRYCRITFVSQKLQKSGSNFLKAGCQGCVYNLGHDNIYIFKFKSSASKN